MRRDHEREARMTELYRGGSTLQEIGTAFGLTRERVRQILKRAGVTRKDGGIHRRAAKCGAEYRARVARRRENLTRDAYGCSWVELNRLNGGVPKGAPGCRAKAYKAQQSNCRKRGLTWQLTFPEWCRVWDESGKWEQRGRGGNSYVMARKQDLGPYAAWNVYVTTMAQNTADYQAELKRRGVKCEDGYHRLPERIAAIARSEAA